MYRTEDPKTMRQLRAALQRALTATPTTDQTLVRSGQILARIRDIMSRRCRHSADFHWFCSTDPVIRSRRTGTRLVRIGRWLQPEEVVHTNLALYGLEALAMIRERHQEATLAPVLCDSQVRYDASFLKLCQTARDAADPVQADEVLEAGLRELSQQRGISDRALELPLPPPPRVQRPPKPPTPAPVASPRPQPQPSRLATPAPRQSPPPVAPVKHQAEPPRRSVSTKEVMEALMRAYHTWPREEFFAVLREVEGPDKEHGLVARFLEMEQRESAGPR